jgi:O-antigen/teichoic acid export membrane protein
LSGLEGSGVRRAVVGAVDQVTYSVTNFLVTVFVARESSGGTFGAYAVLFGTALVAIAINRGMSAEPLIIRHSAGEPSSQQDAAGRGVYLSVSVGLGLGLATAAGSLLLLPSSGQALGLVFGGIMPMLLLQDYCRYAGLALRKPTIALMNDAIALLLVIAIVAGGSLLNATSSSYIVGAWGVSELAGACVALLLLRLPVSRVRVRTITADLDLGFRLGADNFATQIAQQGATYAVAGLSGLTAAAGLRAAQTALTPISVLTQSVQTAILPEFVRLRARGALRRVTRLLTITALGLALISAVLVLGILVMPDAFGTALFGGNWFRGQPLIGYLGIGTVAGALANTAVLGLRVLADARTTLAARTVAILMTLALVTSGAAADGARGAAVAIAVASTLQMVVWWTAYRLSYRRSDGAGMAMQSSRTDPLVELEVTQW